MPKRRKNYLLQTVSRPFRRRRELSFPDTETSKNCHFVKGNPTVSYFGGKLFHVLKRRKNGHFANGKPAVSPEAGICFFRLRNFQKCSLRERETARFVFREEIFSGTETSIKIVISRTVSRLFPGCQNTLFHAPKRP